MSRAQRLVVTIDLGRTYHLGSEEIDALRGVNLTVHPGQFIAVVGRSGSGKTTLLNMLAGLDQPTSGQVLLEERDLSQLTEKELTEVRRHKIGFVFQSFGLLPLLSAFENVELPLRICGVKPSERAERTDERVARDGGAVEQGAASSVRAVWRRATARGDSPSDREPPAADRGRRAHR